MRGAFGAAAPLPVERLREAFVYEPESGLLTWRINRGRRACAGSVAGYVSPSSGYVVVGLDDVRSIKAHRVIWAIAHGEWPMLAVDHIDGDRTNNKLANLRLVTPAQNRHNLRRARADNGTGRLGVCLRDGRYRAQIQVDGKKLWLGEFDCPDAASAAYIAAKRRLHSHGAL
jgi:hypothetical protein